MALLKRKRVGLTDAMSVVTKFVNACNRHDADTVASCLHADFDSIQPMYPSRNFRGADQVRRNWQAIFDAEPGFRLTVLRSASTEDTAWLELHGAGRDAEVAGIFIMGIVGDRIRWARIYSALVEPVAEGGAVPGALHEVPPLDGSGVTALGEVVEEDLIAPVLDIERSGRRRRRDRGDAPVTEAEAEPEVIEADAEAEEEAEAVEVVETVDSEPEVVAEVAKAAAASTDDGPDTEAVPLIAWDDELEPEDMLDPPPAPEPEVIAVVTVTDPDAPAEPGTEPELVADVAAEETGRATASPELPKRRFTKRPRP